MLCIGSCIGNYKSFGDNSWLVNEIAVFKNFPDISIVGKKEIKNWGYFWIIGLSVICFLLNFY